MSECEKQSNARWSYHGGLEDFVGDGGQDTLVVVDTQRRVNVGQLGRHGPEQDAQRDVNVLHVCRNRKAKTKTHLTSAAVASVVGRNSFGRLPYSLENIKFVPNNSSVRDAVKMYASARLK